MSTNGSYVNASPPCPAPMTRAALIALRNAGQLRTECHYVVTDGPVIGTAGNTSATVIELHAMAGNRLSLDCKVQTTFDPNTAWDGEYDIDLGAAGSIQRLTDLWNNTAQDADANAPTVHTQVPWHRGSNTFRDNSFDDCVLPGWATAAGDIRDNTLRETTVDLTGRSGGTSFFRRNTVTGGSFTCNTATGFQDHNQLVNAVVSHTGAGAGSFSFQNNVMLTGSVTVDPTTTAQVTLNNNVFGGTSGGYRVQVTGKTGALFTFSGNRAFNNSLAAQDILVQGSGRVQLSGCTLNATDMSFNSAGDTDLFSCEVSAGATVRGAGTTGTLTLNGVTLLGAAFTSTGSGAGGATVTGCYLNDSTVTVNSASSSLLTMSQVDTNGSTLTVSSAGAAVATVQRGRVLGSTLNTAGFSIDTFDVVGGTKTLTANQSDRLRNASFTNLI